MMNRNLLIPVAIPVVIPKTLKTLKALKIQTQIHQSPQIPKTRKDLKALKIQTPPSQTQIHQSHQIPKALKALKTPKKASNIEFSSLASSFMIHEIFI